MKTYSRREFIRVGSLGLAVLGSPQLFLQAAAAPTESSGDLGDYSNYLKETLSASTRDATSFAPTEENVLGPFYRPGAPYRAKIPPPRETGTMLRLSGRVWGFDTRKPLASATLDVWQANSIGRYDNDDKKHPPEPDVFKYRVRLVTNENGFYEFETIHPGKYQISPTIWRPSHIHYMVSHPGYRTLVTQIYFQGDPLNKADPFIRESLIIDLNKEKIEETECEIGTFDIVLQQN